MIRFYDSCVRIQLYSNPQFCQNHVFNPCFQPKTWFSLSQIVHLQQCTVLCTLYSIQYTYIQGGPLNRGKNVT
jgi:hypothetical protein